MRSPAPTSTPKTSATANAYRRAIDKGLNRSAAAFSAAHSAGAIMTTTAEFKRKDIRLSAGHYRGRAMYFVTLCFHDRRRFGANSRVASWLVSSLRKHASVCAFFIHAYCVMPDHMHLLAVGASEESNLIKFVESFKQETAFEFSRRAHRRLWQFKYYDRILRASDAADRVAWYIWLNPVRKGFCRTATDYPFVGSFTELGVTLLKGSVARQWTPPWKRDGAKTLPR